MHTVVLRHSKQGYEHGKQPPSLVNILEGQLETHAPFNIIPVRQVWQSSGPVHVKHWELHAEHMYLDTL